MVSSTVIKDYIKDSNIKSANNLLGYSYKFDGIIVKGDGRGAKINYPTLNINPINNGQLIPKNGVYCVDIKIDKKIYLGMCNIGTRPTFYKNGLIL